MTLENSLKLQQSLNAFRESMVARRRVIQEDDEDDNDSDME